MKQRFACLPAYMAICIFFTIGMQAVKSQPAGLPVSDRIVLTAGPIQITEYEILKNYLRFQQEYKSSHGHLPDKEAVNVWRRDFTDRTYILADARDKGYFEKEEVNRAVESMTRLIIGQPGGLLEKKLAAQQEVVSEKESQAIKRSRTEKAIQAYYQDIKKEAAIVMNPDLMQALQKKLAQYGALRSFDKDKFSELLPLEALTYTRDQQRIRVTMAEFVDYYNSLPLKKEIISIEMAAVYMQAYVLNDFTYRKADKLGITRDLQFRLDKDNYKKTVIDNLYEKNELKAAIEVTDREISDRYEMRKQDYKQATAAKVTMLVFDTRYHAVVGRAAVWSPRAGTQPTLARLVSIRLNSRDSLFFTSAIDAIDTTHMIGLLHFNAHRLLPYNEASLPDTIRKVIFAMPVGDLSPPLPVNGQYMIVIKESESGERIQGLPEVKDKLRLQIMEEKFRHKKQTLLEQLKQKYKLQGRVEDVLSSVP